VHQGNVGPPGDCQRVVEEVLCLRGRGRIINIRSVVGETGSFGQANYAASKSGLLGLTGSLTLETDRKDITVNCLAPGYADTDMVAAYITGALIPINGGLGM
jgi:NAD(P)-dependent dehydrogenase (short-subunit alcohol dehydrogenase family)